MCHILFFTGQYLLQVVDLNYGMKEKNPIDHARFYKKGNPDLAIEIKKEQVDVFVIPLYCFLLVRITSFNFNSLNYSLHHLGV